MYNELITVDLFDKETGRIDKESAHRTPVLHRAFSVFLYDENKILLQRRNENKYHSGGLWTNACCSHPRSGMDFNQCVRERMKEEIGVECRIEEIFIFVYYCRFSEELYEYEYDHVFVGKYGGEICFNENEVSDVKWMDIEELMCDVRTNPRKYTVWFISALPEVVKHLRNGNNK